jgi:hypothetical protein
MSENIYWRDALMSGHRITRELGEKVWKCDDKVVYWLGGETQLAQHCLFKAQDRGFKEHPCQRCGVMVEEEEALGDPDGEFFCSDCYGALMKEETETHLDE